MKTLRQWLEEARADPEEGAEYGITTTVQVPFSLTLFQGNAQGGGLTGQIGVEINFPPGANGYVLIGQVNTPGGEAPTLDELADLIQTAFGIKLDDAIWDDEPL